MNNTMTPVATDRLGPNRSAAKAGAIGFLGIAGFQAALALGAPLGAAAWGGADSQIPASLRIASGIAAAMWGLAAVVILGRGGFHVPLLSPGFVRRGIWVLVAVLPLGAVMNFASPSPWERFIWGPVALILAVLSLVVARSGHGTASETAVRAAS
jgi:hypothetical protein